MTTPRTSSGLALLAMLVLCLGSTASSLTTGDAAPNDCPPRQRIDWPAHRPLWSLCWVAPDSSSGIDGSGLELRDVSYRGQRVLRRAGLPLINVDYDPGGCGSYRDWQHGLMVFEADGALGPPGSRYAEPRGRPRTMCDHPGIDAGDFAGVAAEKSASQLVLTTQLQAGPYRYVQTWTFREDGSLDARVAFTSRIDPCNAKPHRHHAYWRLEFDVGSDGRDHVEEYRPRPAPGEPRWARFRTETSRRNDPEVGGRWRVSSTSAGRGYEIASAPDGGVADSWAVADFWVLAFHPEELDDGGARQGPQGGRIQLDRYLNGESVDGAHIVLWIHAMDRHHGSVRCHFVGPTLRPVGNW